LPVLVDKQSNITAGHCRVLTAERLGFDEVPVTVARGWSDGKQAYVIANNKLAPNAAWDDDLLHIELTELKGSGADLDLTGFGELELDALFGSTANGQTDPMRRQICRLVRSVARATYGDGASSLSAGRDPVGEARSVLRARLLAVRRQLEELLPEAAVRYLREAIAAEIKRLSV
jgi:hypothetical protein